MTPQDQCTDGGTDMAGKRGTKEWQFTAADIIHQRDTLGNSWKAVAIHFGIGNSGGVARRAYTDLTGVPHYESRPLGGRVPAGVAAGIVTRDNPQRRSRAASSVVWTDDSDQGEVEAALQGTRHEDEKSGKVSWLCKLVTVKHSTFGHDWEEQIPVRYAMAFTFGPEGDQPLQVSVIENMAGATRTFRVADVVAVV
jgi:hypothetical protein